MKRFRVLFLGAGFSVPAGLPLAAEMFPEVLRRARGRFGSDNAVDSDLADFIEYKHLCDGVVLAEDEVDFEEFLSFLDIEHHLALRGSDTWSREGNSGQIAIKRLIGGIIQERTPQTDKIPSVYLRFASLLDTSDVVVTFNYDVILERALDAIGKPYRLFQNRFSEVGPTISTVDTSRAEVVLLKMHGSVDWFDRRSFEEMQAIYQSQGFAETPRHKVFGDGDLYQVTPLVDGPRDSDDPLRRIHRIRRVDDFYSTPYPAETPFVLSPSQSKILYALPMQEFWFGLGKAESWNLGLAIIGYSMPGHDDYVRQGIYRTVRNYLDTNVEIKFDGVGKGKIALVDYRPTEALEQDLRRRYRFVDWDRTELRLDGFSENALPAIFDNSP